MNLEELAYLPHTHHCIEGYLNEASVDAFIEKATDGPHRIVLELDCHDGEERAALRLMEFCRYSLNHGRFVVTLARKACGGAWPAAHAGRFGFAADGFTYNPDAVAVRLHRALSEDPVDLLHHALDLLEHELNSEVL